MGFRDWIVEKLNPGQPFISANGTLSESSIEPVYSYQSCYEKLEVVNRAVNMIVDDVAEIKCVVGEKLNSFTPFVTGVRKASLERLLNKEPNPFQDINSFRRALVLDFIIDGNIFIYWDGAGLYHIPANKVKVIADKDTFVSHYEFDSSVRYESNEIIHVKDNNYHTIYRGASRLRPALRTMQTLLDMRQFQDNFFKNGATPGLYISTEERLNERYKAKLLDEWRAKYRPASGGRRPIILDGGMKIQSISSLNFHELDFQNSVIELEKIILKSLGIPPVLLDGGNNVNIRPNHRLYYLETVLPIISKMNSAFERMFGFEVYEDTSYIHALRPELREEAGYYQSLVNGGIMSAAEARDKLGLERKEGHDDLRIPANIAGSAVNPSEGGRPPEENND